MSYNSRLNHCLAMACRTGNEKIVESVIKDGADDWNWGFSEACYNGHLEISKLMISKGAKIELEEHLATACSAGHIKMVKLILEQGEVDVKRGLANACSGGHKEVVELMIENGADNFNDGLICAEYHGRKEIAIMMILYGADINKCYSLDFDDVYYLLHHKIKFPNGIYIEQVKYCKKWKLEFENVANELFIKDVASVVSEY